MPQPNPSFDNGVQVYWDSTSIKLMEECPRKYFYSMILQKTALNKSGHLLFGGFYASALESFFKYRAAGFDFETALFLVVRNTMQETWDYETGQPMEFPVASGYKSRSTLVRSIVWYLDQFGKDESGFVTYHLASGEPAVELTFKLPIETSVTLCGHLDRVVSFADDLYVTDQKTTGTTIGAYFFKQFKPDTQMSLYSYAGRAILKSPIRGVMIDGAQIAAGFTRFERGFTYRTPAELEEWLASALYQIHTAQHFAERASGKDSTTAASFFPMNSQSCGNYGGCAFREVCSAAPHVRDKLLIHYPERVWNPSEAR